MRKYVCPLVASLMIVFTMSGCISSKKLTYFQNAELMNFEGTGYLHDQRIMPKDMLTIMVTTSTDEASRPFNKYTTGNAGAYSGGGAQQNMYGYAVDDDGTINFPVIGRVPVAGLTRLECENKLHDLIRPYMSATEDPIVTVRLSSFHVTVLGEVGSPGVKSVIDEQTSIVDIIAMSGDITVYGKRDQIMLIRQDANGEKSVHKLNINDPNIFLSPYYHVQQNDIVYIEPNSVKKTNQSVMTSTSLWISLLGILTSTAAVVTALVKK